MSQSFQAIKALSSAADCTPAWIAERRAIIQRDGHAVRASAAGARIEVQSINQPDCWCALMLPRGGPDFVDHAARDTVLDQLTGKSCDQLSP